MKMTSISALAFSDVSSDPTTQYRVNKIDCVHNNYVNTMKNRLGSILSFAFDVAKFRGKRTINTCTVNILHLLQSLELPKTFLSTYFDTFAIKYPEVGGLRIFILFLTNNLTCMVVCRNASCSI